MSKGDAGHAAQHSHGIQGRQQPANPQTVLQRLASLEGRVAKLEVGIPVPPEVHEALDVVEDRLAKVEASVGSDEPAKGDAAA